MHPSFPADERAAFSFPEWSGVLDTARLGAIQREVFRREIFSFLGHCRKLHAPATVALAKSYLERRSGRDRAARAALRWFFSRGTYAQNQPVAAGELEARGGLPVAATGRPAIPPAAGTDMGRTAWERALIVAAREKGFLWRTEHAYRAWAGRFVRFIAPRSPWTR